MIYQVFSTVRPNDFYFIDISNDTWSGWRQGKRFKDLTKYPYSRSYSVLYRGDTTSFLQDIKHYKQVCTYLGDSIESVHINYPEYFI